MQWLAETTRLPEKIVVYTDPGAFFVRKRGVTRPAVSVTDGQRRHPDVILGHVGAV